MPLFWQQLIVAAFVLACAAHLAWRGWQTLRGGKPGCTSCQSCPKPAQQTVTPVVTLDALRDSARRS